MLNQAAVEALYSATYIEDYLDCVENLPDDLQRNMSQMRELDVKYQDILRNLESLHTSLEQKQDEATRKKALYHIQRALIRSQEIGDEKLQLVQQVQDLIENKSRQLDQDYRSLASYIAKDQETVEPSKQESQADRGTKRSRRQRTDTVTIKDDITTHEKQEEKAYTAATTKKNKKKKRKSKAEKEKEDSPIEQFIDPDEPTYCLCEQISYGEMIGCDNDQCVIEWFHFSCVGLTTKPKGRWFCPNCRGDRPNIMKPRT